MTTNIFHFDANKTSREVEEEMQPLVLKLMAMGIAYNLPVLFAVQIEGKVIVSAFVQERNGVKPVDEMAFSAALLQGK